MRSSHKKRVRPVRRESGRESLRGAGIGLAVGVVLTAAAVALLSAQDSYGSSGQDGPFVFVLGSVVLGGLGSVVGYAAGGVVQAARDRRPRPVG